MERIVNAIKRYAPEGIEFVDTDEEADLAIIYAYAHRRKVGWRTERLTAAGKKYAIVQTAIRSTRNPNTEDWMYIWKDAELVWSYYNLKQLAINDIQPKMKDPRHMWLSRKVDFNFYYAPLGVDPEVFKEVRDDRTYSIIFGENRDECSTQIIEATMRAGYAGFMLGSGISDQELVKKYSRSKFVSGLRRKEGFELPVIEGLLCGAIPIVFDRPETRHWFEDLAVFISEESSEELVKSLEYILRDSFNIDWKHKKRIVKERFNWETIIKGFWERIL